MTAHTASARRHAHWPTFDRDGYSWYRRFAAIRAQRLLIQLNPHFSCEFIKL
jgi:hypothetical protein